MTKQEFLKRAVAKNIKESRGHDAPSYEWDVYFDGKKVGNVWDDSYGGELKITNFRFGITNLYKTIDKKSLWDEKYKWTTSLDLLMEELKVTGLMKKDEKKGVMIGTPYNYSVKGFRTSIPTSFKKWGDSGIIKDYQDIINEAVSKGQTILNAEYLRTWNLNI